ncbi:MAG: radical SAM protein, partial [Spirochaetaceae bacterium]|nr:radical SAM protein [Spirochaetaceae bacterium]
AERLRELRRVFSGVLGVDIIYHYPAETPAEVLHDAALCADLDVDSVSFYSLMIQSGSQLSKTLADKAAALIADTETDRVLHNLFYKTMLSSGYDLLELSKLARPHRDDYRYIKIRYDNGDVLPIGTGAGGSIGGHPVYEMAAHCRMVSKRDPVYDKYNQLLGRFQFGEYDLSHVPFSPESRAAMTACVERFADAGLFVKTGDASWRLTADGVFWGNNIAVDVLRASMVGGR